MPRVEFAKDFTHLPTRQTAIKYKAGGTYLISQEAAKEAVAKGVGKVVASPGERRPEAPAAPAKGNPDDEGR